MLLIAFFTLIVVAVFVVALSSNSRPGPAAIWFVIISIVFNYYAYFLYYDEAFEEERNLILRGFIVVSTGLLFFIFGVSSARLVQTHLRNNSKTAPRILISKNELSHGWDVPNAIKSRKILLVASVVLLFPSWLYFILLGYVPLFEGITSVGTSGLDGLGALQTSRLGRDAYLSSDQSRIPLQGLLELFRTVGTPFLVCLSIAQMRAGLPARLRILVIILSVITALMAGQRWPLIYMMVAVVATFAYLRPLNISIPRSRVAISAVALVTVGLILSILQKRTTSEIGSLKDAIQFGVDNLLGRILLEQAQTPILSYLQESFAAGELKGRSYLEAIVAYLPGEGATFPVEFYQTVYQTLDSFTAPPDFFTEAYLNFNWLGVLVIPFLWGILANFLDTTNFTPDSITNIGIKGGTAAVFASTTFTGPSYLIGATIIILSVVISWKVLGLLSNEKRENYFIRT